MKTNISTIGNQVLRSRPSDTILRSRLDHIEERWLQLMCDLPNNEEALHAAQMELMPSRQALKELVLWMDGIDAVLQDDHCKDMLCLMDVELLLQKYRVRH